MSLLNLCPKKAKAILSHAAHGSSEGFGWRISLSSLHHVVDQSDQWLVLWLRSLDNLSTELCMLSRSYRKSTAASGHQDQIKEDQTGATSRSQNLLPISFVPQETHAEAFQPSDVAIKSVSGHHEDEFPAASQHRAVSVRLLTPQKHLNTLLNSSDCYPSYHTTSKCKCEGDMNPLMTMLEIHQRKLWWCVKTFFPFVPTDRYHFRRNSDT